MNTPFRRPRTQRIAEAIQGDDEAADRTAALLPPLSQIAPQRPGNPFTRASEEMADRWEAMQSDLIDAKARLNDTTAELLQLRARCEATERELEIRTAHFDAELARQTQRADAAVAREAELRAKFTIIRDSLSMVIENDKQLRPAPARTEIIDHARDEELSEADRSSLEVVAKAVLPHNEL